MFYNILNRCLFRGLIIISKFVSNKQTKSTMDSNCHRREFFKKASLLAGALVATPFIVSSIGQTEPSKAEPADKGLTHSINPSYRMYCYKDGSVKLYPSNKSVSQGSHSYNGLEVGVLLLIAGNKPINSNLNNLAIRHSMSDLTCKNRTEKALNEFKTKGIISYHNSKLVHSLM